MSLLQIFLAVILSALILLQARGGGLGAAFGGFSAAYRSKRGVEKFIYWLTIVFAVGFFAAVFANFFFYS